MSLLFTYFISQLFYSIRITSLPTLRTALFVNIVFSDEDKILIKNLYQLKGYKATKLTNKFFNKFWTKK